MIYKNTYYRLLNILLNMYKWELPEYLSDRAIELGYCIYGQITLFKSKYGTYAVPCLPHNRFNIYGDPVQVKTQAWNGKQLTIDVKYGYEIPIELGTDYYTQLLDNTKDYGIYSRDNKLAYPYINYVKEYAIDLTDKIVAHHIATQRVKVPYIWLVNKKEMQDSIDELMNKIQGNDIYAVMVKSNSIKELDKSMKLENIQLNPSVVKEIENAIEYKLSMFLQTIGIKSNPQPDKTQVVLSSEINANDGVIEMGNDIRFNMREKFVKDAKKILGIDLKVEKNAEIENAEMIKEQMLNGNTQNNTETKKP